MLYEIANESPRASRDWQYHMIEFIKGCEADKTQQHPVGMTAHMDLSPDPVKGNFEELLSSRAGTEAHPRGAIDCSGGSVAIFTVITEVSQPATAAQRPSLRRWIPVAAEARTTRRNPGESARSRCMCLLEDRTTWPQRLCPAGQ